jgi:hypothetical protein
LDLQERVDVLEERLEYLNSCHQIQEQPEDYQQTISAKDQFIEKLEKEQKQQTQEFNKAVSRDYLITDHVNVPTPSVLQLQDFIFI